MASAISSRELAKGAAISPSAAIGAATSRNGRRPPSRLRVRSDMRPTMVGTNRAKTPSVASSAPDTSGPVKSRSSTGT